MEFPNVFLHNVPRWSTRALLVVGVALSVSCNRQPEWRGTPVTPATTLASTNFSDSTGATVPLVPSAGQAALVFFGYTNCPDVCPTTLADWVRVKQAMGADAGRVRFVFISVDPARDTPAVAQQFAAKFDPSFLGLAAPAEQIANVQAAFGANAVVSDPHAGTDHVTAHSAQTFLVDDRGTILVAYRFGAGWDVMSADLKTLLKQ